MYRFVINPLSNRLISGLQETQALLRCASAHRTMWEEAAPVHTYILVRYENTARCAQALEGVYAPCVWIVVPPARIVLVLHLLTSRLAATPVRIASVMKINTIRLGSKIFKQDRGHDILEWPVLTLST
jgi:hypothetical protein